VILHRVQAHDAGRILESLSTGVMPPDLILCKIEDWTTSPASLNMDRAIRKSRPGTPSRSSKAKEDRPAQLRPHQSSDIEEYIAVGGYQASTRCSSTAVKTQ